MRIHPRSTLVSCLIAALFTWGAVNAQTKDAGKSAQPGAQSTTATTGSATAPAAAPKGSAMAPKASATAALSSGDRKFLQKAMQGSMAEMELGKLAQTNAGNDAVKKLGQKVADDHSKSHDEVQKLASAKGVMTMPHEPDTAAKREAAKLQKLRGAAFDYEFTRHMVADHKKDISEFRAQAKSAKDPDVRNFATSTLPTLEQHLQMAQQITTKKPAKKAKR